MTTYLSWITSSLASYAIFVGAAYGIGTALDSVATEKTKSGAARLVRRDYPSLTAPAIILVVDVYKSVFSSNVFSRRFVLQSFNVYALILFSLIFSQVLFGRSLSVQRLWFSLTLNDIIYDINIFLLFIVGFLLFLLSNAQTLILLNLVRLDPKASSSALILYADALLTASVCALGFGLALSIASAGEALRAVPVRIQFQVASSSSESKSVCSIMTGANGRSCDNLINSQNEIFSLAIPNKSQVRLYARDMEKSYQAIPSRIPTTILRVNPFFQQFIDRSGEVTSFQSMDSGTGWTVDGSTVNSSSSRLICEQLMRLDTSHSYYMSINNIGLSRNFLDRCQVGLPVSITGYVTVNFNNIDYVNLIRNAISSVTQTLSSGLLGHADLESLFDPVEYWSETMIWEHNHLISESGKRAGYIARDNALLRTYMYVRGSKAVMGYTPYPIGVLSFVVMFTSIFSILLFFSAIGSMIALRILRGMKFITSYTKVEEHPFAVIAPSGAVILSGLHFLSKMM